MLKFYTFLIFLSGFAQVRAQSVFAPIDKDYYDLIDRMDIKGYTGFLFTNIKPTLRVNIAALADSASSDTARHFSKVDKRNLQYLRDDNWEWSNRNNAGDAPEHILKAFYTKKNALATVNTKYFQVQINPVLNISYGKDADSGGVRKTTSISTRGIELRGLIDGKVGFYTFLTDNQAVFPTYVSNRIATTTAVPGEGYWKSFKKTGYDFYTVAGYVDFPITKHISTQFGEDRNFIGDGYRSLLLSDYSGNYLFWKVSTKVWKLQYDNVVSQMVGDMLNHTTGDVFYPRKYMSYHYLTYNVTKHFNIGLFECITFGNTDTIHNRQFDPTYLNPIIFFKAAENGLGAPDKDHLGLTWKWNLFRHLSFYGQILIDEFNLVEIRSKKGWWGNKQAGQVGLKYIDVAGVRNLDIQLEGNIVPPYTYTHFSYSKSTDYSYYANYSNTDQPLAHPSGANFYEGIALLRYQPFYRFTFTGKYFYTVTGLDGPGQDWGSNIMIGYNHRMDDYGNYITQGYHTTIQLISLCLTTRIAHNMFIDLSAIWRQEVSTFYSYNSDDKSVMVSFRWNIGKRLQEF